MNIHRIQYLKNDVVYLCFQIQNNKITLKRLS